MNIPQFPAELLQFAAALAVASLLIAAIGLAAARSARRSSPVRHGLLLCTLLVLIALPAAPFAAAFINVDWLPTYRLFKSEPRATGSASGPATPHDVPATLSATEIPDGAILPGHLREVIPSDGLRTTAGGSLRSTPATPTASAIASTSAANVVFIAQGALALWLLGSLVSALRTLRSGIAVSRIVRRSIPVSSSSARDILNELSRDARLRRAPQLRATTAIRVPFAWGLVRSVIVLPQRLLEPIDQQLLRPILLHELAHVRRRDAWTGVVQRIAAAMHWWNPLVHLLNERLADAREQICDAHVIAGGCPSREYAELLVELASQIALPQPAAALGLLSRSKPQLTRRVQHLLEDQPMSTSLRSFARVCLMGLFIVLTTTAVLMAYVVLDSQGAIASTRAWLTAESTPVHVPQAGNWTVHPVASYVPAASASQPAQEQFAHSDPFGVNSPPPTESGQFGDEDFGDPMRLSDGDEDFGPMMTQRDGGDEDFGGGAVGGPSGDFVEPGGGRTDEDFTGARGGLGRAGGGRRGPGMSAGVRTDVAPAFAGPKLHGLALIELVADDNGFKELRWFTESLGSGDEAYAKLTERLTEFAASREQAGLSTYDLMFGGSRRAGGGFGLGAGGGGRMAGGLGMPMIMMSRIPAPETHLAAQITASPQIRFVDLKRVIELCQRHVRQILFGADEGEDAPDITLTLGFVRDGGGSKISSSPVLIWNNAGERLFKATDVSEDGVRTGEPVRLDEIVTVQDLAQRLVNWRQSLSGDSQPDNLTALIRADDGVDPKLVEQVVQATLPAGVERVVLYPLGVQDSGTVVGLVTEVAVKRGQTFVKVSIGADDGLELGYRGTFTFGRDNVPIMLIVMYLSGDEAECILPLGSPTPNSGTEVTFKLGQPTPYVPDAEPLPPEEAPLAEPTAPGSSDDLLLDSPLDGEPPAEPATEPSPDATPNET